MSKDGEKSKHDVMNGKFTQHQSSESAAVNRDKATVTETQNTRTHTHRHVQTCTDVTSHTPTVNEHTHLDVQQAEHHDKQEKIEPSGPRVGGLTGGVGGFFFLQAPSSN